MCVCVCVCVCARARAPVGVEQPASQHKQASTAVSDWCCSWDAYMCMCVCVCLYRHEFVVVETLQFFDDEDESLPAPLSLRDIVNMNKVCHVTHTHAHTHTE